MTTKNILFVLSLTLLFSSPSYAGFWDFLKVKKKEDAAQQIEAVGEAANKESTSSEKTDKPKVETAKPAETKSEKPKDADKQQDADKADAAKKVEAEKAAELAKKAEAVKQADAEKPADAAKKAEAEKTAKPADNTKADETKAAELAKKVEEEKAAKAAELSKKAEAEKAELTKKIDAEKAAKAVEVAKQAEALKAAELAKKAEAEKAAELAKKAEAEKATKTTDIAKQADASKAAELAKKAEAEKAAKAAEAAKQAQALKAAELAKKAEAEKAAKAAEAAKQAEALKAAELAKKAEAEKAAKAAQAAKQAEASKAAPVIAPLAKPSGKFTPVGADMAGNADGSIPAWTGSMNGVPAGLRYARSGDPYPDPYAKEEPLFTIHAGNIDEYAGKVSEGVQALMKKFPDTFFMNVYPSHRDGKINDLLVQRTAWNTGKTKLVNGLDGLQNYTGGIPFPRPTNGAEVMWNGRLTHVHPTLNGLMDDMAVYLNGNTQLRRQTYVAEFPFSYKENSLGTVDEKIGINAAYILVTVEKPDRQKGQITVIHEALDQVKGERKAWVYIPGSRRVRRAPTVGFDTPDGPGGLVTVDDSLGFNGAMVRYDWKLIGKKEMYIPYHNYKFDDQKVQYSTLLQEGHANPEYMRYELHRVWVVEAKLKSGQRHVYAKRRFYVDEDSWQIVLTESYDGRGNLWRVAILNTVYDYLLKAYIARAQVFHDLQSGAYIALRLVNETEQMHLNDTPKGENFFTPANLRKLGK